MIQGYTKEAFVKLANGYHTIAKGDNFWNLDKKYGYAPGTIQKYNPGVKPNALRVGGRLRLAPAQQNSAPAPQQTVPRQPAPRPVANPRPVQQPVRPTPTNQQQSRPTRYQIQPGDNYEKIGGKFGIARANIGRIRDANPGVKEKLLRVGSYINLPVDDKTHLFNTTGRSWDWKPVIPDDVLIDTLDRMQLQETTGGKNTINRDSKGYAYSPWQVHVDTYNELVKRHPELKQYPHEALQDPNIGYKFVKHNLEDNLIQLNRNPNIQGTSDSLVTRDNMLKMHRAGVGGIDSDLAKDYLKKIDTRLQEYKKFPRLFNKFVSARVGYTPEMYRKHGYPVWDAKNKRLIKPTQGANKSWIYPQGTIFR